MIAIDGTIDKDEIDLLNNLGRFITWSTDDLREIAFLLFVIQRYSVIAVLGTFVHTTFPLPGWNIASIVLGFTSGSILLRTKTNSNTWCARCGNFMTNLWLTTKLRIR